MTKPPTKNSTAYMQPRTNDWVKHATSAKTRAAPLFRVLMVLNDSMRVQCGAANPLPCSSPKHFRRQTLGPSKGAELVDADRSGIGRNKKKFNELRPPGGHASAQALHFDS